MKNAILPRFPFQTDKKRVNRAFYSSIYHINQYKNFSDITIAYDIPIPKQMKRTPIFVNLLNRISCKCTFNYDIFRFKVEFEITNKKQIFVNVEFMDTTDELTAQRYSNNYNYSFFASKEPYSENKQYNILNHLLIKNMVYAYRQTSKNPSLYFDPDGYLKVFKIKLNQKNYNRILKTVNQLMDNYINPFTEVEYIYYFGV